jgi:hypothetical protein
MFLERRGTPNLILMCAAPLLPNSRRLRHPGEGRDLNRIGRKLQVELWDRVYFKSIQQ